MFSNGHINLLPVNIPPIIRELLLHNEKAVIPGFGTLSMVHRPAELNKLTGVLLPPAKAIRFDHLEKTDDGQLTDLVARKQQMKKSEAVASVAAYVKSIAGQLSTKGAVYLEGIGDLRLDKAGNFQFKPQEELLSRANMFGLPRLDIPVARPAKAYSQVAVAEAPTIVARRRRSGRWWIPVTLALVVVGLLAVVYLTGFYEKFRKQGQDIVINSGQHEDDDRLVFGNRSDTTDTLTEKISRELENRTNREQALKYEEPVNPPGGQVKAGKTEGVDKDFNVEEPYHIIAGSFQNLSNAEKQKAHLEKKGFPAVLLPKRGRFYMVSLGSFNSHEQAVAAMKQLRAELEQELWVMKMQGQ
jgi:nucleoid DNA-binding protein